MSQIFDLGLTFCFINSGKLSLKKMTKSYQFFQIKQKPETLFPPYECFGRMPKTLYM